MSLAPDYSANDPKGWCGDPSRGAAMGRTTIAGDPMTTARLHVRRVRLNAGGYDRNGTYFGHGDPLYWIADGSHHVDRIIRAKDRAAAVAWTRAWYPNATVRA